MYNLPVLSFFIFALYSEICFNYKLISCGYYLLLFLHCVHVRNTMDIRMDIEGDYIYSHPHQLDWYTIRQCLTENNHNHHTISFADYIPKNVKMF